MKIAYFDCFSGISGDMILGAMVDAGLPVDAFQDALDRLKSPGLALKAYRVHRCGLSATKVDVIVPRGVRPFTTFAEIERCIKASRLPKEIQARSIEIFGRLAKAEAQAHGRRLGQTHLHEVGAIDTLADVVGAVVGCSLLKIDRIVASPIHVGTGEVKTDDGVFPIPAPATAVLLKGFPLYATGVVGELTTPTGAAIITTLAESFLPLPSMKVEKIGSGAGRMERTRPNILRLFIGVASDSDETDEIIQVETNIDDMNPQVYEHLFEALFSAGAVDVFLTPVIMKRGRPAILLTALTPPAFLDEITQILFRETTTLGLRIQRVARRKLVREVKKRKTPYGPLRVKTAFQNGKPLRSRPEFREVRKLSKKRGLPLSALLNEVERAVAREVIYDE